MGNFFSICNEDTKCAQISEALLHVLPFEVDIVDGKGEILYMNDVMKKRFGEKGIGQKCWLLYKDDKTQCNYCPLKKGIVKGQTAVVETQGVMGGKTFKIYHIGMEYANQDAVLEVFVDVTDLKKKEKEVLEEKKELGKVLEQLYTFRISLAKDIEEGKFDEENRRIKDMITSLQKKN